MGSTIWYNRFQNGYSNPGFKDTARLAAVADRYGADVKLGEMQNEGNASNLL